MDDRTYDRLKDRARTLTVALTREGYAEFGEGTAAEYVADARYWDRRERFTYRQYGCGGWGEGRALPFR